MTKLLQKHNFRYIPQTRAKHVHCRSLKPIKNWYPFNGRSIQNRRLKIAMVVVQEHPKDKHLLPKPDILLLTLMSLRLGGSNTVLGLKFNISTHTVTCILDLMFSLLAEALKGLVVWPEGDAAKVKMPELFKPQFNVVSVIDCFEVSVEMPNNPTTRTQHWSDYHHAYTVKFLLSIMPAGTISFISSGSGGGVSDS